MFYLINILKNNKKHVIDVMIRLPGFRGFFIWTRKELIKYWTFILSEFIR